MKTRAGSLLVALILLSAGGFYLLTIGGDLDRAGVERGFISPGQELQGTGRDLTAHTASDSTDMQAAQRVQATTRVVAEGVPPELPMMALGWVLDTDGQPLSGVTVHVREHEEPEFLIDDYAPFEVTTVTNTKGRFEVPVEYQGQYTAWAVGKQRGSTQIEWMRLNPRHPQAEVELRFAMRLVIEGLVLGIDSRPVAGVTVVAFVDVEASGIQLPSGATSTEIYGRPSTRTNRAGHFRLETGFSTGADYVVRAEALQRIGMIKMIQRIQRTGEGGRGQIDTTREPCRAEISNVAPGTRNLLLTLQPLPAPCILRLKLVTEDGGTPPRSVRAELRQVGPHGGVYWSDRVLLTTGSDEGFEIKSLVPGARYTIGIPKGLYEEEVSLGPFTAAEGETEVRAVVPGLFTATIRINDPKGRLEEGRRVQILRMTETGMLTVVGKPSISESLELELDLPTGSFFVQIDARHSRLTRSYKVLMTESLEMSARAESFVFEVP